MAAAWTPSAPLQRLPGCSSRDGSSIANPVRATQQQPRRSSAAGCRAAPPRQRQRQQAAGPTLPPRRSVAAAAIKGVDAFDGSFQLEQEQREKLDELLYSEMFCQEVVRGTKQPEGTELEFTGVLFQPQPWTPTATKGMPKEVEEQYHGKPEYTCINVPPVFMFQAKVFQPPRLCAVYKRK